MARRSSVAATTEVGNAVATVVSAADVDVVAAIVATVTLTTGRSAARMIKPTGSRIAVAGSKAEVVAVVDNAMEIAIKNVVNVTGMTWKGRNSLLQSSLTRVYSNNDNDKDKDEATSKSDEPATASTDDSTTKTNGAEAAASISNDKKRARDDDAAADEQPAKKVDTKTDAS